MKSSSKSDPRSWLLEAAKASSECRSSYAWSLCHAFSFRSFAILASSFCYIMGQQKFTASGLHGLTCSLFLSSIVLPPKSLQVVFFLFMEIRKQLNARLVQSIDNRVLPLGNQNLLDLAGPSAESAWRYRLYHLSLISKPNLSNSHGAIFFQVVPRGIDDGDIILLIA